MDAVILFSHGSLLCGAGEALEHHAARLRERGLAPIVTVGYLNYSSPPFLAAVKSCVEQGATRIIVTPYFLVPGYFVKVDLPKCIDAAREVYPALEFVVAGAIGFDAALADALIASAHSALPPSEWRRDLARAVSHCRANPQCPLYGSAECQVQSTEFQNTDLSERIQKVEQSNQEVASSSFILHPSSLLIMVHGSPRPIANQEMYRVVEVVKEKGVFPIVEVGFMECNEPTIPDAIDSCIRQGAKQILAIPYFLHTGTHVADDLPTLLEEGRERHPDVDFRMGAYLGRAELLTNILEARTRAALTANLTLCS